MGSAGRWRIDENCLLENCGRWPLGRTGVGSGGARLGTLVEKGDACGGVVTQAWRRRDAGVAQA